MRLSVVIVNYNVKFFLEQVLLSVRKAAAGIATEVLVVDNHSTDGSTDMVRQKFPEVILVENFENLGFSKANNQAIRLAKGEYVLLLNPDTIVAEDTFHKCLAFMDAHPDAGGLGVKMIDGKGNFLPESKRSFPSPKVAFYKAFGFSRLFPRSKEFARYHLGNLSENETHAVEVLAGAFMLIRNKVLQEIGLLDEDFFMYGEDIDLSYRIIKAGYKNYYLADTTIIHYKGESTKKSSVSYVGVFYNAMIIFARKHFAGSKAGSFILLLKAAIYFRAAVSVLARILVRISFPVIDAALIFAGMFFLKNFWQNNIKAAEGLTYPDIYMYGVVPAYIFIWIASVFFSGGYDRSSKIGKIIRGIFVGTVVVAALYGFVNEEYRCSRALIVLGAAWAAFSMISFRLLFNLFVNGSFSWGEKEVKRVIIAGSQPEALRVQGLLNTAGIRADLIGFASPAESAHPLFLGRTADLEEIIHNYKIDEIIFCSADISSKHIFGWIERLGNDVEYKIVPEGSDSIIGSNSKDTQGELYTADVVFNIVNASSRRNKRIFDLISSLALLLTVPLNIFFVRNKSGYLANIFRVMGGYRTLVGFSSVEQRSLPRVKKGVLMPADELRKESLDAATMARLDFLYAKDYSVKKDMLVVLKGFRNLGR